MPWPVVAGAQYEALVGFAGMHRPTAHPLALGISHTLLLTVLVVEWCHKCGRSLRLLQVVVYPVELDTLVYGIDYH